MEGKYSPHVVFVPGVFSRQERDYLVDASHNRGTYDKYKRLVKSPFSPYVRVFIQFPLELI